jgi:hypothetical protein
MYTWIYSTLYGHSPPQSTIAIRPPPSAFKPICHPNEAAVSKDINGYYLKHWNFLDEKARTKFVAAGFSKVTCLYFPKALESRIRYACSLLTILFLIDGEQLWSQTYSSIANDFRSVRIYVLRGRKIIQ